MLILLRDYKKGIVKLLPQDQDDLWYVSELIEPQDIVTSVTSRKIKIGDSENAKSVKKTFGCYIIVETVEYTGSEVRINGKIQDGPQEAPTGSYQSISIEEKQEFTLQKDDWSIIQRKRLDAATQKKEHTLIVLFDRDEALFATCSNKGFTVLFQSQGEVAKKDREITIKKEFYDELSELLSHYVDRLHPQLIILASPAFYKDEFKKNISKDLSSKVITATVSAVNASAFSELLSDPDLASALKDTNSKKDQDVINVLLTAIAKNEPHCYGVSETILRVNQGAVKIILITDGFIRKSKEAKKYGEIQDMLSLAESSGAEIHILKSEMDPGKRLDGLGGIGGLLRYKV